MISWRGGLLAIWAVVGVIIAGALSILIALGILISLERVVGIMSPAWWFVFLVGLVALISAWYMAAIEITDRLKRRRRS